MDKIIAVVIALSLQVMLRSFIFELSSAKCSGASALPGCIFLLGYEYMLWKIVLTPMDKLRVPYVFKLAAQIVAAVGLTEFGMSIVWCSVEEKCYHLCETLALQAGVPPELYHQWKQYILGGAIILISYVCFWCFGRITDRFASSNHFVTGQRLRRNETRNIEQNRPNRPNRSRSRSQGRRRSRSQRRSRSRSQCSSRAQRRRSCTRT